MVLDLSNGIIKHLDYPTWHWSYYESFTRIKVRGPREEQSFSFNPRNEITITENTDFRLWIAEKIMKDFNIRGIIEVIMGT